MHRSREIAVANTPQIYFFKTIFFILFLNMKLTDLINEGKSDLLAGKTPICFDKYLKNMPREERLLMPNVIIVSQLLLVNPATNVQHQNDQFPWHAELRLG